MEMSTGVVPDILKISRIVPVDKSGDANEPHNYRPISMLSVFSKLLERLVYNQLHCFLEKYNKMFNYQFGLSFLLSKSVSETEKVMNDEIKKNYKLLCL